MKLTHMIVALSAAFALTACEAQPGSGSETSGTGGVGGTGYDSSTGYDSVGELAPGVADRVFFDTDSSALSASAQATLSSQAAWLKQNGSVNISVEGHADERGTREYNIALGERRAYSAKKYLVSQGVSPNRISTVSYGKERPAVVGSNNSAWSQNRRGVAKVN